MDKSLSLRLGRASILQDWDINIPRPTRSPERPDPYGNKWLDLNYYLVQLAEIQGQVYQHLYSPGASSKTNEERAQWAIMAAARLQECHSARQRGIGPYTADFQGDVSRLLAYSDEVVFHSVMALIYRAIPPPSSQAPSTFSLDCLYSARKSLQAHLQCANTYKFKNYNIWAGYLHWYDFFYRFTLRLLANTEVGTYSTSPSLRSWYVPCSFMMGSPAKNYRLFSVT